jgi:hypothetical protein
MRERLMNESIRDDFAHLWGADRDRQYNAFQRILAITGQPVDWVYEVWGNYTARIGVPPEA